jgi:dTMP kinase
VPNSIYISFPNRLTDIGKIIDQYLKKEIQLESPQAVHLLFSANRWETQAFIKDKLKQGIHVICDRYHYSGLVYTLSKLGIEYLDWCKETDNGLIVPDMVFYMDIKEPRLITSERYEAKDFLDYVRAFYTLIQEKSWIIIDGNREDKQCIQKDILFFFNQR